MKISYNWLCEYIKTDLPAAEMAAILTDIGLEVESLEKIEAVRGGLEGVVVGEVLTCTQHPDADRLNLTTVDVAQGEPLQVVCGAPNVAAGQKVLVATIGTTLYPTDGEEFKIKRSKIRGVESLGMICAADELGIGDDHSGIMVLDPGAQVGAPASQVLGLEFDYRFEIGLTPNRIDAASHWGVARDLAAYLRSNGLPCELQLPDIKDFKECSGRGISIEVANHEAAPRYAGVTMTGVKVAPSPAWLQARLRAIGINPKNNVVDITNFVLHELGEPLHAFDCQKIKGGKIVVRTCPEGTPFTTLDGVERKLSSSDLMICDAERPMCIAGVFGGIDSSVTDTTSEIFIESAYFNPTWVRKTAKRHALSTDASFRFERGADPDMIPLALRRAALLVQELAGGTIASEVVDIYPQPIEAMRFEVSLGRINSLIGKEIPDEKVRAILRALDIKIEKEQGDMLAVVVPPYRVDVRREADLVEEILRIYGYNNVEISDSVRSTLSCSVRPDKDKVRNLLSDALSANGFAEIMSNSLTTSAYYDGLSDYPSENCVRILNPLSSELDAMRQTLLFGVLEAARLNANHRRPDLRLYEFGNCYRYDASRAVEGGLAPYSEVMRLSIAITGQATAASWNEPARPATFFDLRAAVERLLARLGLDIYRLNSQEVQSDIFAQAIAIRQGEKELLRMGVVAPKLRADFDLKNDVFYAEIDFDQLLKTTKKHAVSAQELSKFPEVRRDLALLVDKGTTFAALRAEAFTAERKLLRSVSLFDVYEGDKLPEGKKSYALGFVIEDPECTLTDEMTDRIMGNIIARLEKLGAQVRS